MSLDDRSWNTMRFSGGVHRDRRYHRTSRLRQEDLNWKLNRHCVNIYLQRWTDVTSEMEMKTRLTSELQAVLTLQHVHASPEGSRSLQRC